MPVYVINGQKIKTEAPLSDAEIDEIGNDLGNSSEQSFGNLLKQGFSSDVGLVTGVADTLTSLPRTSPDGAERSFVDEFGQAYQKGYDTSLDVLGGVPTKESTDLSTRMYESGIRAIGAPTSYLGALGLYKTPLRALGVGAIGATAEGGGDFGAGVEKYFTGEDTGAGRLTGALLSPILTISTASFVKPNLTNVYNKFKEFRVSAKDGGKAYAQGAAKRLLERAATEIGTEGIEQIVSDFNAIGSQISKGNYPLLVSLSDNPALRQQAIRLAKTDPDFRKKAQDELERIAFDIDANANKIFGERFAPIGSAEVTSIKNVQQRIAAIDKKIEELANNITPSVTKEQTGQAIANLVEAKKTAVKGEMRPLYAELMAEARDADVKLPKGGVASVYNFIVQNNIRDIFGKGTLIDSSIQKTWSPKGKNFQEVPFDQVDSLKRRINELQRGNLNDSERRKLFQLEQVVDEARASIPGGFNDKLKQLDMQYYERLGVPFGAAGVRDIDAKKYAEQVAPVITNNGSALKQFLNAGGEEGLEIAKNAVMADVYFKTVKDGKINIGMLNKYLKDKSDVINQIPGLRTELINSASDQRGLLLRKEQLDNAYKFQEKKIANNFLTQYGKEPDFTGFTNKVMNNRRELDKLFLDLKQTSPETSKAVVNNVRRELLQTALASKEGSVSFLTNPRNKYTVEKLFGVGYQNRVKELAKLNDAISKADLSRVGDSVTAAELDAIAKIIPGADIPYLASNFRDRISSVPQKIIRILSRVQTSTLKNSTDDAISKLLLDPNGMEQLLNASKGMDLKNLTLANKRKIVESFANMAPSYFYVAGKSGQESDREERETINQGSFY